MAKIIKNMKVRVKTTNQIIEVSKKIAAFDSKVFYFIPDSSIRFSVDEVEEILQADEDTIREKKTTKTKKEKVWYPEFPAECYEPSAHGFGYDRIGTWEEKVQKARVRDPPYNDANTKDQCEDNSYMH